MSYTDMVSFINGFEDSEYIDFGKMSTPELFGFIDKCKSIALVKCKQAGASYWMGIAQKALTEVMNREAPRN